MRNAIFWQEDLVAPVPDRRELPAECDVAVMGAGLTGLATSYYLAGTGLDVHVFDRSKIGDGASTRNGGMTLAGLKLSPQQLIRSYGREQAISLYAASLSAIDHLEKLIAEEDIDCEFSRYGALWAAYTAGHYKGLAASQRLLSETFQHETFLVSKERMADEIGSDYYHGGLVDPVSAGLHPGKLTYALAQRALQAGVTIHEQCEIKAVEQVGEGIRIRSENGDVRAGQLIIATNGYTPACVPKIRRRIIPIGSYILVTEALPADIAASLLPNGRMAFDTKKFLYYFRRVGNRLLFGGRTSFSPIADRVAVRRLAESMLEVYPQLRPYGVDYYWSGHVGFTFDQMPHIGCEGGIHYAMGYCGHGVAMSVYCAHALAGIICGEDTDLPYAALPFQSRMYYRQKPWFLPIAGSFYNLVDRFAK